MHPAVTGSWHEIGRIAVVTAAACGLYLAMCALRLLWGRVSLHIPARAAIRALPLLGISVAVTSSALARERRPAIPHRSARLSQAPPWSEPGGYSPPHPPGRAGVETHGPDQHDSRDRPRERRREHRPARALAAGARLDATYEVRPGDCLWSIAAHRLETDDGARIAHYWPRVHSANRATIGSDPDVIHPGQALVLPDEHGPVSQAGH